MIRKSTPSGSDPTGGNRFCEKHALWLEQRDDAQIKG
jgi:hypothetical protein